MALSDAAELFMKFDYLETKDLCKQFLTLISGVLVLSVTFSEKIVATPTAPRWARSALFSCWTLLILSIVACGGALLFIAMAGGEATRAWKGYPASAITAYKFVIGAGVAFIAALVSLATAGAAALFRPAAPR